MEIAWAEFTPVASFGGGAMIGVLALFLMLLNGRIMGMSGILSGLLVKLPDWPWRLAFVIGVMVGTVYIYGCYRRTDRTPDGSGRPACLCCCLFGWFGYCRRSGCTSGHGICGLSRLSLRSFVAVMAFMVSAVITVVLVQSLA